MRITSVPLLAVALARPAPPAVTFLGVSQDGVSRASLAHGAWIRTREPSPTVFVHARRGEVHRDRARPIRSDGSFSPPGSAPGDFLLLADVPITCEDARAWADRVSGAVRALDAELASRGVPTSSFDDLGAADASLSDPEICALTGALAAAGPSPVWPNADGVWAFSSRGRLTRRWGWDPAAGWDAAACMFRAPSGWWGTREDWWLSPRTAVDAVEDGARMRGTVSGLVAGDGGWGWTRGTFDVPVCEIDAWPMVLFDTRR